MEGVGGSARPSSNIGQALNGGYGSFIKLTMATWWSVFDVAIVFGSGCARSECAQAERPNLVQARRLFAQKYQDVFSGAVHVESATAKRSPLIEAVRARFDRAQTLPETGSISGDRDDDNKIEAIDPDRNDDDRTGVDAIEVPRPEDDEDGYDDVGRSRRCTEADRDKSEAEELYSDEDIALEELGSKKSGPPNPE